MFNDEWNHFRDDAERDCEILIGPELAAAGGSAVYVALGTETGANYCDDYLGETGPFLMTSLWSVISGRWRGSGPAMLINNALFNRHCFGDVQLILPNALAVIAHELAHIVLMNPMFHHEPRSSWVAEMLLQDYRQQSANPLGMLAPRPPSAWADHGPQFTRIATHIFHRMKVADRDVSRSHLMTHLPNQTYVDVLMTALEDECRDWENVPLGEIARAPPSESFLECWTELNRRHHEYLSLTVPITTATKARKPMSSVSVLDRLESRSKSEREAAVLRLHQYAVDIADGNDPSESDVAETLRVGGKTLAELKSEVAAIRNRRELKAQADRLPLIRRQGSEIQSLMNAKDKEFAAIQERFRSEIQTLLSQQHELGAKEQQCHAALSRLQQTAPPSIVAQISELGREKEAIRFRRGDRNMEIKKWQPRVTELKREISGTEPGGETRRLLNGQLDGVQRELDKAQNALAADDRRSAELQREIAALEPRLSEVI